MVNNTPVSPDQPAPLPSPRHARRTFRIVAQDPSVTSHGRVLMADVSLPNEDLIDGPMGYAAYVLDYDATAGVMYEPAPPPGDIVTEPHSLLDDPNFHALNAYAIVMRTLLRFELALGRRVAWGIRGHQIKVIPHAFEQANAYYSPELEALVFGYIRGENDERTYLCLSHDIVAHETAHALLDGLRDKFMSPSSPDQAALHEAFADIVALLSVFSLPEVATHLLQPLRDEKATEKTAAQQDSLISFPRGFVPKSALDDEGLQRTALFGLAEQMRAGSTDVRANALRRSVQIPASRDILQQTEFQEEHRRGEVLVAAVMRGFLKAWVARIDNLASGDDGLVDLRIAAEQGADIADTLLTMAIRAVDYTPPIHITFGDYLSAMLTADSEVRSEDGRYRLRDHLIEAMDSYGITPASGSADGRWAAPRCALQRGGSHLSALQTDPTEMFRHIWSNRDVLNLNPEAHTRVRSVRPCLRVSPEDGFQVHETVVECTQYLKLSGAELRDYHLTRPADVSDDDSFILEGGSTLILDEYGDLKFEVSNRVLRRDAPADELARWQGRLDYLCERGYLDGRRNRSSDLAAFHLQSGLSSADDGASQARNNIRYQSEAWS